MKLINLARKIVGEKCPNCGKGHVYVNKGNWFLHVPVMKDDCDQCNYHFEREQGYFIGAMYLSYGLAVLQGITAFVISYYLLNLTVTFQILVTCLTMVIFAFPNFRLSRIMWMYIFPN